MIIKWETQETQVKKEIICPRCKKSHTVRHGFNVTKSGKWARRKCQECGATFYENKEGMK